MATIQVQLPRDRRQFGSLSVMDSAGADLAGPFEVFGKADNAAAAARGNPTRDPTRSFGDTPTGRYRGFINKLERTPANERMYGPQGVITLDPLSGQAKVAKENGRFGLLIHGGALNAAGRLRPTFGCLRLANESMQSVLAAVENGGPIEVVVKEVA
ncbi:MAG: L,D-transpeptidase [Acidobacteria bacterium]|nr:L,D-transpeptidase [Acidobacteriota bacterium]